MRKLFTYKWNSSLGNMVIILFSKYVLKANQTPLKRELVNLAAKIFIQKYGKTKRIKIGSRQ